MGAYAAAKAALDGTYVAAQPPRPRLTLLNADNLYLGSNKCRWQKWRRSTFGHIYVSIGGFNACIREMQSSGGKVPMDPDYNGAAPASCWTSWYRSVCS